MARASLLRIVCEGELAHRALGPSGGHAQIIDGVCLALKPTAGRGHVNDRLAAVKEGMRIPVGELTVANHLADGIDGPHECGGSAQGTHVVNLPLLVNVAML